jgi:hypothetical protein
MRIEYYIIFIIGLSLLYSCSSTGIPEYLDNRIVKDTNNCIFIIEHSIGDNVIIHQIQEPKSETCLFKEKN